MEDGTDSKNLEGCEGLDPSEEAGIKDEGCWHLFVTITDLYVFFRACLWNLSGVWRDASLSECLMVRSPKFNILIYNIHSWRKNTMNISCACWCCTVKPLVLSQEIAQFPKSKFSVFSHLLKWMYCKSFHYSSQNSWCILCVFGELLYHFTAGLCWCRFPSLSLSSTSPRVQSHGLLSPRAANPLWSWKLQCSSSGFKAYIWNWAFVEHKKCVIHEIRKQ